MQEVTSPLPTIAAATFDADRVHYSEPLLLLLLLLISLCAALVSSVWSNDDGRHPQDKHSVHIAQLLTHLARSNRETS